MRLSGWWQWWILSSGIASQSLAEIYQWQLQHMILECLYLNSSGITLWSLAEIYWWWLWHMILVSLHLNSFGITVWSLAEIYQWRLQHMILECLYLSSKAKENYFSSFYRKYDIKHKFMLHYFVYCQLQNHTR